MHFPSAVVQHDWVKTPAGPKKFVSSLGKFEGMLNDECNALPIL
jgi:hypothetical protein